MSTLITNLNRLQKDVLRAAGCLALDEKFFTKDWSADQARIVLGTLPDDTVLVSATGSCVKRERNRYYYAPTKSAARGDAWQPLDNGFGADIDPYNLLEDTVEAPKILTYEDALKLHSFYIVYRDGVSSWDCKHVTTRLNHEEAMLLQIAVDKGWPIVATSDEAASVIRGLRAKA